MSDVPPMGTQQYHVIPQGPVYISPCTTERIALPL